jgi:H+-translocating NAD(P) transhydrogenase subunit beta
MGLGTGTILVYLLAAALFIFGIRLLRSPATARIGNLIAAVGMFLAVVVTFFEFPAEVETLLVVGAVTLAGSLVGALTAVRVPMTSMPQFVAAFNGVGGGAAALIGFSELYKLVTETGHGGFVITLAIMLGIVIGSISFAGSVIAFVKLEEIALGGSVSFPLQKVVNAGLALVVLAGIVWVLAGGEGSVAVAAGVLVLSLLLGVLLVIPIGGADMPIVISLLNAFTGLAAAASGFALGNTVLIIAGALVGASGTILTYLMSGALGRPLSKILFGAVAAAGTGGAADTGEKPVTSGSPEDVAATLAYDADSVIFIPGYGLAVAQAQGAMADLMRTLEAQGKDVKFAIHPVAGRMPGHMNVLLAEAEVPADKLFDLEDVNDQFVETDAVVIVGANDVVNPIAREDGDSPIAGMPILNADQARRVVIIKRSLSPGFAGIDNPLFYDQDRTTMLFSDAKAGLEGVTQAVKNQG